MHPAWACDAPHMPETLIRPGPLFRPLLLAACLCLAPVGWAQPAAHASAPADLSFEQAQQRLLHQSHGLAAARAGVDASELRAQALSRLGGPSVAVTGMVYAYNANLHMDLDGMNQSLGLGQLPLWGQDLTGRVPIPQLPGSYTLNRSGSGSHAALSAVWPIYAGGVADAARGLSAAQQRESQADLDLATQSAHTLLVERYFSTQLALQAARLRRQAELTVAEHDTAAERMLAEGVIARVERLQASAALQDARQQRRRAEHDAELAQSALHTLLQLEQPARPSSPLFVISQPLEPLQHFVDAALSRHPGLDKVQSKREQAAQLHEGQEAIRRPQVIAFGTRQLKTGHADWSAGLGVRWTLYDAVDRKRLASSSLRQMAQAEHSQAQLQHDLQLLVERNWRAVDSVRQQYLDMGPSVELADEVLRLREAGLREGTSTMLELIEAQTQRAAVLTQRAQIAHAYVQALAALLESAGLSEQFPLYMARADIRLP